MDWNVVKSDCNMFHNPLLHLNVLSYSIHIDRGAHVLFHDTAIARQLISMASHASDTSGLPLPPWQKILVETAYHPQFFIYIQTWRSSFEVQHAEMDTLKCVWLFILSIPQESWLSVIWKIVCDLPLHEQTILPVLAGNSETLVNYFWVA